MGMAANWFSHPTVFIPLATAGMLVINDRTKSSKEPAINVKQVMVIPSKFLLTEQDCDKIL